MFKTIKLLGFLLIVPISVMALSDKELALSINLSGKQRMLSQKMTKESFLIRLDIDKQVNIENLTKSSQLFDKILNGLLKGDESLNLMISKNKEIDAQLKKVQEIWKPFYKEIQQVISGNATDASYEMLEKNNLTLLKEMNSVVGLYLSQKKGNTKLKLANDINLAGKQRMLTQRMGKDLLFINNNLKKDIYLKDFKASQKLFTETLDGLLKGSKTLNLSGTKLPKIVTQLKVIEKLWKDDQVLLKGAITNKELKKAIAELDRVLVEMNKGVTLYTQSVNRQKQRLQFASLIGNFMDKSKILKKRVNLSGKQRMLTQRMTKLALLISSNIDKESNRKKLIEISDLYNKTLNAFKKGDKDLGCIATNEEEIKKQIVVVEKEWTPFYKHIQNISNGSDKDGSSLAYIISNNEKLLQLSDNLVKKFEASNKSLNYLDKARLHIVNIAGRQRMLTQKMTKEKLLIVKGKKENSAKLEKTIKLFDTSLTALIKGDKELALVKSSNKKIISQLEIVANIWKDLKPLYEKTKLNTKDLAVIIKKNPLLLKEMNAMVKLAELEVEY